MYKYTTDMLIAKKFIHPRVKLVLENLSQLSPAILPRDADQPKQGSLQQIRSERTEALIETLRPVEVNKPETFLTLNSSLLNRRKNSIRLG